MFGFDVLPEAFSYAGFGVLTKGLLGNVLLNSIEEYGFELSPTDFVEGYEA